MSKVVVGVMVQLLPLLQSAAWCSRGLLSSARTPVPLTMSATSTPPSDLLQLQSMALPLLEAASSQVMLPGDVVTIRLNDAPREWAHAVDHSLLHCDGATLCRKRGLDGRFGAGRGWSEPQAAGDMIWRRN